MSDTDHNDTYGAATTIDTPLHGLTGDQWARVEHIADVICKRGTYLRSDGVQLCSASGYCRQEEGDYFQFAFRAALEGSAGQAPVVALSDRAVVSGSMPDAGSLNSLKSDAPELDTTDDAVAITSASATHACDRLQPAIGATLSAAKAWELRASVRAIAVALAKELERNAESPIEARSYSAHPSGWMLVARIMKLSDVRNMVHRVQEQLNAPAARNS